MYRVVIHCCMIVSAKGKRASEVLKGRFGKGFPADLVRRTRAMRSMRRLLWMTCGFHRAITSKR